MKRRKLKTLQKPGRSAKGEQVSLNFLFFLLSFAFCLFTFALFFPFARQTVADRYETKDSIIYSTDPDMDRIMEERAREEKEKEQKAWQMLQNMNIYKDMQKRPPRRPRPDNTPSQ